jgi:hypothetical protein
MLPMKQTQNLQHSEVRYPTCQKLLPIEPSFTGVPQSRPISIFIYHTRVLVLHSAKIRQDVQNTSLACDKLRISVLY